MAKKENKQETINELVRRCKNYVFDEILFLCFPPDTEGYDLIHADVNEDGWDVILRMGFDPNKLYAFSKTPVSERVSVSTYIRAHWFSVDNF